VIAASTVQRGDVGEWAAAAGTVAAVVVALALPRRERRRAQVDAELRELDETRRLLMIVMTTRADQLSLELLGTLAHALVRHCCIGGSSCGAVRVAG